MHLPHLHGVLFFYLAKVKKSLDLQAQQNRYIKMFTYLIVTDNDKIECIKRCELLTVVIAVHGSY
jgi:hypothetical protein